MNPSNDTPLNDIFKNSMEKIDSWLIPPGQGHPRDIRNKQHSVAKWIDRLGEISARSQGLPNQLTTADKFQKSVDQQLYLFIDRQALDGKGAMIGILRTGPKKLYFHKQSGEVVQKDTECVFDFFVMSDYQRHGIGKKLYDFMLQDKGIAPYMLAIDRPSTQMMNFQKKYYGLKDLQLQPNHFAVDPKFLDIKTENKAPVQEVSTPIGRYAAHRPRTQIESIIHNEQ